MANPPSPSAGSATGDTSSAYQYGRVCTLIVSNKAGKALDLSALRIKFAVKKSGIMTPNVADILVYNISNETVQFIQKEFTKVTLSAGYVGNFGVIFSGNIKQIIAGRESATDTFINLIAGDGDEAYNFAIVNQSLKAGSSRNDQLNAALVPMANRGVGSGYIGALPDNKLPRGKVMYGNSRDYIKSIADSSNFAWSMQDEKVIFISQTTYLPNEAVTLSSKTGMIGTPQQTIEGIMCKCLLNPKLKIHGRIQIDNKSIAQFKLDQFNPGSPANTPVPILLDGFYYISVAEHIGDTRGTEWYTNLTTLTIDPSSNILNDIHVGAGT